MGGERCAMRGTVKLLFSALELRVDGEEVLEVREAVGGEHDRDDRDHARGDVAVLLGVLHEAQEEEGALGRQHPGRASAHWTRSGAARPSCTSALSLKKQQQRGGGGASVAAADGYQNCCCRHWQHHWGPQVGIVKHGDR